MEKKNQKKPAHNANIRTQFLVKAIEGKITFEHLMDLINALDSLDRIMNRPSDEIIN